MHVRLSDIIQRLDIFCWKAPALVHSDNSIEDKTELPIVKTDILSGNSDISIFESPETENSSNLSGNGHTDTSDSESIILINSEVGTKDDNVNVDDEVDIHDTDLNNMSPTSFVFDYKSDETAIHNTSTSPVISTTPTSSVSRRSVI
ncbi:unnamed protein product [Ambrosiozyma monospora]|uniref:Unnamed protein product n=1 Tax=Ambrosiozyma monospora TaxID=43982 RepID=A0ACB5SUR1_AMBMO|nr:unnamed protein product [Ambrosiozyma monospora]